MCCTEYKALEARLRAEAPDAEESPSESKDADELLGSSDWGASKNFSWQRFASGGLFPAPFIGFLTSLKKAKEVSREQPSSIPIFYIVLVIAPESSLL